MTAWRDLLIVSVFTLLSISPTMPSTLPMKRTQIDRIRQLMRECLCPTSCLVRLKMCLESGECRACKVGVYGKRAQIPEERRFDQAQALYEDDFFLRK